MLGNIALEFYRMKYRGNLGHARVRPASTKSNAMPLGSEGRSETMLAGGSCFGNKKFMKEDAKTRNLERIRKKTSEF
jgi:hypothetical protein